MKFMGYELYQLRGATAVMRDGSRAMILKVIFDNRLTNYPFTIKFYEDKFDDSYARDGFCNPFVVDCDRNIISIELPKKEDSIVPSADMVASQSTTRWNDVYNASYEKALQMQPPKIGTGIFTPHRPVPSYARDGEVEYEVFEITKYADLDTLNDRWDELEKVTTENGLAVLRMHPSGNFLCGDETHMYALSKGNTLHLYPKKEKK